MLKGLAQDLEERFHLVQSQGEQTVADSHLSRYQFSTLLLQKYVREQIRPDLLRVYHGSIASALEQIYGDLCSEIVVPLAEHYVAADDRSRAVPFLIEAGDRARLMYANAEAIRHYRRALDFLNKSNDYEAAARTAMKLALTCHNAFDYAEARRNFNEGFRLWQLASESRPVTQTPPAARPLRMDWPYQPLTLDRALADDGDSVGVIDQLFSGLVDLGQRLELLPSAAESWEILDEGLRYVFHLRPDGRWSDGVPVTAHDFVFAWQRALKPGTGSLTARQLYDIQGARALHSGAATDPQSLGARALDDLTLEVRLEQPASAFLYCLAFTVSYPAPRHAIAKHGPAWTEPGKLVGNGPFRLVSWKQIGDQEGRLVLTRSATFRGASSGNLGRIELVSLPNSAKRLAAYEQDHLDVLSLRDFPDGRRDPSRGAVDRSRVRARHAGEYISAPFLATTYIGFNTHKAPFSDRRVRLAFVHTMDRERYADDILQGFAFPATGGFVPAGMPGHSPDIGFSFDPQHARALLNTAGFSNPADFPKIEFLSGPDPEGLAAYLAKGWREELGLQIEAVEMDWEAYSQRLQEDPPDLFLDIWMGDFPDPDNFLRSSDALRWLRWDEPRYQALVDAACAAENQEQRLALYRQADRHLINQAALAPVKYLRSHFLLKPWVKRFPTSPNEWWYCKDVVIET